MDSVNFIKQFPIVSFKKDEVLLSEGQQSTSLFAIRDGFVKVTSLDENGAENLLWIEGRYDTVPTEKFFTLNGLIQFYYTALSDGTYYDIDKKAFLEYARHNDTMMAEIAFNMSSHYDDLLQRVNSVEQVSVHKKIVSTLHYLAEKLSANDTVDFVEAGLRLTHKDLAALVGSTRETVSLELQKLKKAGLIDYDTTKFIVYRDQLIK
jgi:CRP/FNR family transcriptional regulator, cyclic AMP receptor protein